jgi:uncharacterized membrane protein
MNTVVKRRRGLRRYLVAGVLVWLPILATLWVVRFLVQLMDSVFLLLPESYRPQAWFDMPLPGLGAVFALLVLFVTGVLVTNLIGRRLVTYWEKLMQRIPLVRSVYGGVKGFTESVFSQKNSFRKVVMFQYPRQGIWSIGFVTADNVAEVSRKTGDVHVCIYVPTTPNPTSGFILFLPRTDIVELDMSVDAAMKLIITCGVVVPQS